MHPKRTQNTPPGAIVQCSRDIAVVYYLTRNWRPEFGGAFVDIAGGGREYCPAFNTAVAFTIPRWHAVTAVVGPRPRFSVFGWFLVPGIAYPLGDGERDAAAGKGPAPERWLEEGEVGRLPQRCKLGRRLLRLESRGLS
uniref:Prolyl 4-hydroxylase alpha subunit Fe(2+) 2OG dioxygenase domain-containing protein n=1 Tax=Auxenochlorella protothecoides TaxID=3075 RepID=A0A1D1ZT48_AUXPR